MTETVKKNDFGKSREFQANERTFLAWIRTSIALMGFGFVIVKFSLFLKEIAIMLESPGASAKGYSSLVGVIMVALGVIIAFWAFVQYKRYDRQLKHDTFIPLSVLPLVVTFILISGGIVLILYLLSIV
ncbi:MAG: DUF202 domain-containing protein [Bacteroidales bacterium]|nr:DUF202 domain-containing protein [Bacteroidales bacterium]